MEQLKRKRNRLPEYDYGTTGAYFVTICTEKRRNTLCEIVGDGFPVPKTAGEIAEAVIQKIPVKYPCAAIDSYVIMPNHIHLILRIEAGDGMGDMSPTLGTIVGWYKYQVTKQINANGGNPGDRFFQRSFHDHVIRGEKDYSKIWAYIEDNPRRWKEDSFYVE